MWIVTQVSADFLDAEDNYTWRVDRLDIGFAPTQSEDIKRNSL